MNFEEADSACADLRAHQGGVTDGQKRTTKGN